LYENRVGQFALATIITSQQDDLLRIVASYQGRTDDTEAELATFELLFEESVSDALTTVEANNLIKNLHQAKKKIVP
jgi:hypothetical protein